MKLAVLEVPAPVTTVILTVPLPLGTIAVITEVVPFVETSNEVAFTEPNLTAVAFLKLVPVISMEDPSVPFPGEMLVITGLYVKSLELEVPAGVVTVTAWVFVPFGTTAVILEALTRVNEVASVLPNLTDVVPLKLEPLIVIVVPAKPLVGEIEEITGP